ncbi:formate/nitrite transporter family protein [Peribacillus sp. NPDC060186]
MGFHSPPRIAQLTVEAGTRKATLPLHSMLILGFLGGAYISIAYLLDNRVIADLPKEWGTFGTFLGAAVFPLFWKWHSPDSYIPSNGEGMY